MAIFKRQKKRSVYRKTRESLWPSMGWGRAFHYYRHRLFRTDDSTYKIAAGLAAGAAVSFTPFLGTHILQSFFLCWVLRANYIAGLVGTLVGNPWTFPFLFLLTYKSGVFICSFFGLADFLALPDPAALEGVVSYLKFLVAHPVKLLLPLAVGGYLWAIFFWFVAYAVLYHPVRVARATYKRQRLWVRPNKKIKETDQE